MNWLVSCADAIAFMDGLESDSVDLVFGSPPYELARTYFEGGKNLGIARKTDAWVEWMVRVYTAAQRVSNGLVAFVVAGQTKDYRWSAGPALLMAALHQAGFNLRNPPIYHRVGIPGSGGPDWLRADYELVVCTTRLGRLPWSENTACGEAPKWAPGGAMSHRKTDGSRIGGKFESMSSRGKDGKRKIAGGRRATSGRKDGDTVNSDGYDPPAKANPGNSVEESYTLTATQLGEIVEGTADWQHYLVGGGLMGGDEFARQNEAPFSEKLAEFFVKSFCPPGGTVLDCFSGSGTTGAVAVRNGRNFIGCDLRQSQVDLSRKRIAINDPKDLFSGAT